MFTNHWTWYRYIYKDIKDCKVWTSTFQLSTTQLSLCFCSANYLTQILHVWNIWQICIIHFSQQKVGKYSSPDIFGPPKNRHGSWRHGPPTGMGCFERSAMGCFAVGMFFWLSGSKTGPSWPWEMTHGKLNFREKTKNCTFCRLFQKVFFHFPNKKWLYKWFVVEGEWKTTKKTWFRWLHFFVQKCETSHMGDMLGVDHSFGAQKWKMHIVLSKENPCPWVQAFLKQLSWD